MITMIVKDIKKRKLPQININKAVGTQAVRQPDVKPWACRKALSKEHRMQGKALGDSWNWWEFAFFRKTMANV